MNIVWMTMGWSCFGSTVGRAASRRAFYFNVLLGWVHLLALHYTWHVCIVYLPPLSLSPSPSPSPSLTPELGAAFSNIGVYEPQQSASVAFMDFGSAHKLVYAVLCVHGDISTQVCEHVTCIVCTRQYVCLCCGHCLFAGQWQRKERSLQPRLLL